MSVNSTTGIYQSENNFDKFRVYVSPVISGHSVDTLTVNLNIVNPDEEMDIIELKLNKDTSNYFTQDLNLGVKYTSLPGQYRVYIKFINAEGVVGKTNCIHYVVEEIDEPADAISEKFITIIDQYNSRLIEIDQKIQEAGTVISISNERSTPTSTIVFSDTGIMRIFDDNTFTSGGFFASNGCVNAKYIFFPQTVTNIGSGVCAGLTKLEHVYIDNDENSKTLTVASGAFSLANGETATVHYKKDFHYGEFVARFLLNIKSRLSSLESNMSDLQNKITDDITNLAIKNQTTKANSAVITDSSNYSILDLQTDNDDFNISLYGKNLLNTSVFIRKYRTNAYVAQGSMIVDSDSISYNMTEGNYCGVYFKYNEFITDSLLVDKPCVFSLIVTVDKSCTFRLFDESNSQYVTKTLKPNVETLISLNTTITQSAKALTMYGVNITETTHIKLSNMMLELGDSATEYEPYQGMQSVSNSTDLSNIHTYYPNTTVISDCDCQITYVADTKNYTDHRLTTKENIANKKNAIDGSSVFYPSNSAVKNYVANELNKPNAEIETLKSNKLDKTEFNSYRADTDKAVGDNADNINLLDTNKADLVRSQNLFDWSKLLTVKSNIFTVNKTEDEGYRIAGTTVNKYQQILTNQKLQLDDGDYYISDSAINNTDVIVYCQLALVDTDGKSTYYNNAKVTIDNSKYTSIYLTVQTGTTVGEVDTVIYPMLCRYDDANIQYLPHRVAKGVTLLAKHMPEMEKDISDKANNIICVTDKSTSSVVTDSSQNYLKALTLYGNSVQSAVPTPTAPVNIDNIVNPQTKLYRKNLFDFSVCKVNTNDSATINSVDRDNCTISFTTSETGVSSGVYLLHIDLSAFNKGYGIDYTKLGGKPVALSFDIQSDINCRIGVQFTKYIYNYFDITPKKQRIVVTDTVDINKLSKAICFYTNKTKANITISNIQIEVNNTATDYEDCDVSKAEINCTLCKINNIADTLTVNADGTGYITQNLLYERLTSGKSQSGHTWQHSTTSKRFYRDDTRFKANFGVPNLLCNRFKVADNERDTTLDETIGFTAGTGIGIAIRMLQFDGDVTAWESWLDSNEVYVLVPLKKPIVTELSKDQVDKILSLYTYYPSTTVVSDCDSQLTYIADPKNYIDNKILEVATALVAHESEVN